jgi:hypothetical protein
MWQDRTTLPVVGKQNREKGIEEGADPPISFKGTPTMT